MSNQDWRDGFKEGFEAGRKSKEAEYNYRAWPGLSTEPNFTLEVKEHCPKCGLKLTSPMGYVCHSPNCPTFMQVTCVTGPTGNEISNSFGYNGAVGASVSDNMGQWSAAGANGPAGSMSDHIMHHPV